MDTRNYQNNTVITHKNEINSQFRLHHSIVKNNLELA